MLGLTHLLCPSQKLEHLQLCTDLQIANAYAACSQELGLGQPSAF